MAFRYLRRVFGIGDDDYKDTVVDKDTGIPDSGKLAEAVAKAEKYFTPADLDALKGLFEYHAYARMAYMDSDEEIAEVLKGIDEIGYKKLKDDKTALGPWWGWIKTDAEGIVVMLEDGEVVLGFRGTEGDKVVNGGGGLQDWKANVMFKHASLAELYGLKGTQTKAQIHDGFMTYFNALADPKIGEGYIEGAIFKDADNLLSQLRKKKGKSSKIKRITCVGHSLGGAMAVLGAYWCEAYLKKQYPEIADVPVALYTYGAPSVGDLEFYDEFSSKVKVAYRAVHNHDPVPAAPLEVMGYQHTGYPVHLCQPGRARYNLPLEVMKCFRDDHTTYIAAVSERQGLHPAYGTKETIGDHSLDLYRGALDNVLKRSLPRKPDAAPVDVAASGSEPMPLAAKAVRGVLREVLLGGAQKADATTAAEPPKFVN